MKKIVLLSDGTGNGAAKRHKTNVWRLYRALDLHRADQIAMYDDGVGSQQFLPFKLLAGAFGWGLKRNVIELYAFLCRTYAAGATEDESDRIFLFGFSRGAFTVRVLVGLIDACGLYTAFESERDLQAVARANYAIYREKYRGWRLARLLPRLRHRALVRDRGRLEHAVRPKIACIGVWDTVDAYGLPVDQLAVLWDRWISALRFEDRRLGGQVGKACHALAIDEERHTFDPVLWDERGERDPSRIEQVWFPGVHSDVGGGYPRHELALVSLDWMLSRVEAGAGNPDGLVFQADLRDAFRRRCDWNGAQHDSRAGLLAFYRYRPRRIDALCRSAGAAGGGAGPPKVHRSAFERIRERVVPYAPTGLPARYDIVATRGAPPQFEDDAEKDARCAAMDRAHDVIYWRGWLYWGFVAGALWLLASPALVRWEPCIASLGLGCLVAPVCEAAGSVLPDAAAGRLERLCRNPGWLVLPAVLLVALAVLKHAASVRTAERAAAAWSSVKGRPGPPAGRGATPTSRLRALSAGAWGRAALRAWWGLVFVVAVSAVLVAAFRLLRHAWDCAGWAGGGPGAP